MRLSCALFAKDVAIEHSRVQVTVCLITGDALSHRGLSKFLLRGPRVRVQQTLKLLSCGLPRGLVSDVGDKGSLAVYFLVMKQQFAALPYMPPKMRARPTREIAFMNAAIRIVTSFRCARS